MSGTVRSEEMVDYRPTKPSRPLPPKAEPVEHPKYKRAGKGGKCKKCGEVMKVMYRNPAPKGKVHVTYWCGVCKRPRVGLI
jgi:hypothetical protein